MLVVLIVSLSALGEDPLAIRLRHQSRRCFHTVQSTENDITTNGFDVLRMRSQTANVPNRSSVYRAEEAVFGIELWLCLQNIIERRALRVKHDKMANQEFSKYELMPWHAMLQAKVIGSSGRPNLSTGVISKCVVGRMNTYGGEGPRSPIFVSSDTTDSDEFWQEGEETEDGKEVDEEDTISIHEMGPNAYADTPSPNSDSSARWSTETLFNGPQNQFFTP